MWSKGDARGARPAVVSALGTPGLATVALLLGTAAVVALTPAPSEFVRAHGGLEPGVARPSPFSPGLLAFLPEHGPFSAGSTAIEAGRLGATHVSLGPSGGPVLVGYPVGAFGGSCGLLIVDAVGEVTSHRELARCTSWLPPALAVDGGGRPWVAWEQDHTRVAVAPLSADLSFARPALLVARPRGAVMLDAYDVLERTPTGLRLWYSRDAVLSVGSAADAWPGGLVERASTRLGTAAPVISAAALLFLLVAAVVALRRHRWVRAFLRSRDTWTGRLLPVVEHGRARLQTREGAVLVLHLLGVRRLGAPLAEQCVVLGRASTTGEGAFRASDDVRADLVVHGEPDQALALLRRRRDRAWLLAFAAAAAASAPWLAALLS